MRLDPRTLADYHSRAITSVVVTLRLGGCSGYKVAVEERTPLAGELLVGSGEQVNIYSQDLRLQGGMLTRTPKGWILSHPDLLDRCGCGSSVNWEAPQKSQKLLKGISQHILRLKGEDSVITEGESVICLTKESVHRWKGTWGVHTRLNILSLDGVDRQSSELLLEGKDSVVELGCLLIAPVPTENSDVPHRATWNMRLCGSGHTLNTQICVIVPEGGSLDIDAQLMIDPGSANITATLDMHVIFIGEKGRCRGTPTICSSSEEVVGRHSLKTSHLDEQHIGYLLSRGMTQEMAKKLLIKGAISRVVGEEIAARISSDLIQ